MDKSKRKKIIKKVKFKTLFLLMITLASNSFAWFIYTTKVSSNISAKVREWNVSFDVNGENVEKTIEINIDSLYPGMSTYTQTLTASNSGEARAQISYEVIRANILGDDLTGMNYSDIQIINYLRSYYPFSIDFHVSNDIVQSNSEETITISVSWPYESGQDEEDTKWGNLAYTYHSSHPDTPSIDLSIKITAYQIEE
ncbi:MAG: hypothetical protein SO067_06895 [Bacilli bacterium]|nr:hypothetical protein [Clostridium sp.]MDY3798822.1 hypothetical protein [Bacilli bacterium]